MVGIPDKLWKAILYFFYLLIFFLLFLFCEKSPSPLLSGQVRLTAEEVGVTEVWLGVQTAHITGEFSLKVWRDDTCIFRGVFSGADTTVYDSSLRPAHRYRYRARLERNGHPVLESAPLEITTMDTTSHEFQWEIIEIPSPYGSGVLYDVAIINENDIWAVGEIYADSAQPWLPYNAVHLSAGQAGGDGQQWELKRIPFTGWCSAVQFPPLRAIFAFSENDIWFARGGSLVHYNGSTFYNDCDMNPLLDGSINKIWGTDSNNLYAVGGAGSIAHYDGSRWQKIESGTELDVYDIFGVEDPVSGSQEIYAVAAKQFVTFDKYIFNVTPEGVSAVSDSGIPYSLHGVWFKEGGPYYVVGSGMYTKRDLAKPGAWKWLHPTVTPYYTYAIRGNAINDIFVCGSFGELLHFNGSTWRSYRNVTGSITALYEVSCSVNIVAAVGYVQPHAVVVIGRRI